MTNSRGSLRSVYTVKPKSKSKKSAFRRQMAARHRAQDAAPTAEPATSPKPKSAANGWDDPEIRAKRIAAIRAARAGVTGQPTGNNGKSSLREEKKMPTPPRDPELAAAQTAMAQRQFAILSKLPVESVVRYYDLGWRHAYLLEAKADRCRLRSIPAYSRKPVTFNVPTFEVEAYSPATA